MYHVLYEKESNYVAFSHNKIDIRRIEGYCSLNVENGIIGVVHIMLSLRYVIFTNSDYHEETDFRKAYFGYKEVRM